ncbi:MAG: restriction endonuclease subunit S [Verrucomicrobiota bacterium]
MKRWPIKQLGEFVEEQTERLREQSTTIYSVTNERGFVPSLDLFDKQVFSADTGNYKCVGFHDLAYNPSRINVGSVAMLEDKNGGAVSPMYVILRCNSDLLPRYLLHFLKSDTGLHQIKQRCEGAVRFQLKFRDLCAIPILAPPLAEQERIVKLLDEADALRKLRAQADRRTAQLIPVLFHEMFGDPVSNSRNWKRLSFYELLDNIDGGWSPTCHDEPAQPDGWGVLKLGAVTTCNYIQTENKALPANFSPRPELEVKTGDLLFTRKNTYELVAACAFVSGTRPKLMLSDLIFRFKLKDNVEIDPLYLWGLLTVPSKRKQVQSFANGSAGSMPNISKAQLRKVPIEVPPLSLQKEFAKRVTEIREMEAAQSASRRRMEDLFQAMLHRAFNGEL